MKLKNKSLLTSLLIYFSIFSIGITTILYFFQTIFFNIYYKYDRTKTLEQTVSIVEKKLNNKNYKEEINEIAENNEICILILDENNPIYASDKQKHCVERRSKAFNTLQNRIINSKKNETKIEFTDEKAKKASLLYEKKINKNKYILANTSLEPLDRSIELLKSQIKYVGLLIFILSIIASYYFSKHIAQPIIEINTEAKKLGNKKIKTVFSEKSDIKELNELAHTLNQASEELAKAETLRREFIANISHDIKTPITLIEAYAASAKDLNYNNKKKREKDLNIIISEAEKLNVIVNDTLTLSQMRSKAKPLQIEEINITNFTKNILEKFSIYENDGYKLEFNETKKYIIEADRQYLERVMFNLINNAINYTGKDKTVKVSFKMEKDTVKIMITDTGKGLNEEDKKLVWNRYFRTNKRHRREKGGIGLGLSIVREILEAHNFDYGIDSTINKGSTFWFKCKIKK